MLYMVNNKLRFYYVLEILSKYSDENHYINASEIILKLKEDYGFENVDRKTIYEDINNLISLGFNIDSKKGYSLSDKYLPMVDIKIIEDSLINNKAIDNLNTKRIINKLRKHLSVYNNHILNNLEYDYHKKTSFSYLFIGLILESIIKEEFLIIEIKAKQSEIIPYLLHLSNGYYYLYYSYVNKDKIYHVRIDNIKNIIPTSKKHHQLMRYQECQKIINESVGSFISNKVEEVKLEVLSDKDFIINHISDNFENAIIKNTNDKTYINIKVSISNVFFSKISLYQNKIKILHPQNVIVEYQKFLNDIYQIYQ